MPMPDLDQWARASNEFRRLLERAGVREQFAELAAADKYLKQLAFQMRRHEEYLKRRRERCEAMLVKTKRCGRENCNGILSIRETKADEVDVVIGVSLVCNQCAYEKYPSPEYASCETADEFLDASTQLGGTPPFPACFNAFWACELYLRELGGSYYYADGEDEGEFRPPSSRHSLSTLKNKLPKPRQARLDTERCDGGTFQDLLKRLPNGLWRFLRYQEEALSYHDRVEEPQPSIAGDGRLLIDGVDVYEILVQLGKSLRKFMRDEFRRNLG